MERDVLGLGVNTKERAAHGVQCPTHRLLHHSWRLKGYGLHLCTAEAGSLSLCLLLTCPCTPDLLGPTFRATAWSTSSRWRA